MDIIVDDMPIYQIVLFDKQIYECKHKKEKKRSRIKNEASDKHDCSFYRLKYSGHG